MRASSGRDPLPGAGGLTSRGPPGKLERRLQTTLQPRAGEGAVWAPEESLLQPGRQGRYPEKHAKDNKVVIIQ